MTGSYFRGDADAVLTPQDEEKFDTVTYTYYEQLNGYEYLKQLDIGYFFYAGSYADDILKVLDPTEKTIVPHPKRKLAREHKGQYKRGRAHPRVATELGRLGSGDGLPARENARGSSLTDRRPGG